MDYYSQDLGKLWSSKAIKTAFGSGVHFRKRDLPFRFSEIAFSTASVLEIGSSYGQCYRMLLSKGIDLGPRYTGIDVSEEGVALCQNLYPRANWVCGDFLTTDLGRTFDYVIEKSSIQHMPSPLKCLAKAIDLADVAIKTLIRVRTLHGTLSDLDKAYFTQPSDDGGVQGYYFHNLVNLYEAVNEILSLNSIGQIFIRLSLFETDRTLGGAVVVPPDVLDPADELYYCQFLITKGQSQRARLYVRPSKTILREVLRRPGSPGSITRFLKVRNKILEKNKKPE
jgi:hypothetical protein